MGFIHGLVVILVIFEEIIIQCKGTAPIDSTTLLNLIEDAPIIEISGNDQFLPNDLIEVIVSKSDFKIAQTTVRSGIVKATKTIMGRILRDRIILITPHSFDGNTREYYEDGDIFLKFGSYRGLMSLFDQFGDQVKKIQIFYAFTCSLVLRNQINQNIVNRYANNLDELRIRSRDDKGIWEEMSNGNNGILFPEVKKFQYIGGSSRKEFKLNLVFPKLESFKWFGSISDINCLANVTKLKELKLQTKSIQEDQFDHIFANNKNMTRILLAAPIRTDTMHAIAKNLTKLETLEVHFPAGNFLFRSKNRELYKLASVVHFDILFYDINELIGELSFDMPHLKKLILRGRNIDNEIINFIDYFKELETVEIQAWNYNPVKCIEQLKNIKEFTANSFENSQLYYLRNFFEHFDEKSKLQTLKFLDFVDSYQRYDDTMQGINIHLAKSKKPTWKLSQVEQKGKCRKYLMFKRAL